jgi:hypothetical protein
MWGALSNIPGFPPARHATAINPAVIAILDFLILYFPGDDDHSAGQRDRQASEDQDFKRHLLFPSSATARPTAPIM